MHNEIDLWFGHLILSLESMGYGINIDRGNSDRDNVGF